MPQSDWLAAIRARDPHRAAEIERRHHQQRLRDNRARRTRRLVQMVRDADARTMLGCSMRAEGVRGMTTQECGRARKCFLCAGTLPKRRQWWCSDACVTLWASNHEWTAAVGAALRRDHRTCQKCGRRAEPEALICRVCETAWPCIPKMRADRERIRQWTHTPIPDPSRVRVQVNHIVPLVGRGYHGGCHHHLDGLEVLCEDCHKAETKRQAAERRLHPPPRPVICPKCVSFINLEDEWLDAPIVDAHKPLHYSLDGGCTTVRTSVGEREDDTRCQCPARPLVQWAR